MLLGPRRSSPTKTIEDIEVMGLISPNIPATKPKGRCNKGHISTDFFSKEILGLRMKPIGLKPTPDAQVPLDYARWCDADPPENLKVWHGFRGVGPCWGIFWRTVPFGGSRLVFFELQ